MFGFKAKQTCFFFLRMFWTGATRYLNKNAHAMCMNILPSFYNELEILHMLCTNKYVKIHKWIALCNDQTNTLESVLTLGHIFRIDISLADQKWS